MTRVARRLWDRSEHPRGRTRLWRTLHLLLGAVLPLGLIGTGLLFASAPAEAATGIAPYITSGASTSFFAGQSDSFQVTVTGAPAPTLAEQGALPQGISLSPQGRLAGTPSQADAGKTYEITITASNGVAPDAQQLFTLTVSPGFSGGNSTLGVGGTLKPGQSLKMGVDTYILIMQPDGNLVEYVRETVGGPLFAMWSSGTDGHPGAIAVMQGDGNFVVYGPSEGQTVALWSTGTWGHPGATLYMGEDGSFYIQSGDVSDPSTLFQTPGFLVDFPEPSSNGTTLTARQGLMAGMSLTTGPYTLVMQTDGNLVLYGPSGAMWSSGTAGHPGAIAVMQSDGNFVVYDLQYRPLYWTGTYGQRGAFATLWYTGSFIVWSPQFVPIWGS